MPNIKPPKKSKFPKTNLPAAAAMPPEPINAEGKDYSLAEFAAVTADVCHGLHSYLRTIKHDASTKPLVSPHIAALQQLALASTWLLHEHANKKLTSFNKSGASGIKATKVR
ncbi:hypothetical protein ACVBEF_20780 [Glaciimonas sp. GG7]